MAGSIQTVERSASGEVVKVTTKPCVMCFRTHEFILDAEKYADWQNGKHIQDLFPGLSPEDREILISGTCDECFNRLNTIGDTNYMLNCGHKR